MSEEVTFFQICDRLKVDEYKGTLLVKSGFLPPPTRRVEGKNRWSWEGVLQSRYIAGPKEDMPHLYGPARVYFVAVNEFVKIGYSGGVKNRMREMQVGSPYDLELLHAEPGNKHTERAFHYCLKDARWRGEWFHRPPVETFIEQLKNKEGSAIGWSKS